ncbi:hypothetical protein BWR10_05180 [Lacticaseibacillus rhamnosus]|uniref:DUF4044 domain-containing protein n=1 Tax=Lacticaseibacillus rhamnosus TaxID=47715 RepID=A0AAX0K1Z7_LACRH|nr:hypothetical protein BWR10_05180 [Lacticaseibacillus rhamnosus]
MTSKNKNLINQDISKRIQKENEEITKPSKKHFETTKAVQITVTVLLAVLVLFSLVYSLIQIL